MLNNTSQYNVTNLIHAKLQKNFPKDQRHILSSRKHFGREHLQLQKRERETVEHTEFTKSCFLMSHFSASMWPEGGRGLMQTEWTHHQHLLSHQPGQYDWSWAADVIQNMTLLKFYLYTGLKTLTNLPNITVSSWPGVSAWRWVTDVTKKYDTLTLIHCFCTFLVWNICFVASDWCSQNQHTILTLAYPLFLCLLIWGECLIAGDWCSKTKHTTGSYLHTVSVPLGLGWVLDRGRLM